MERTNKHNNGDEAIYTPVKQNVKEIPAISIKISKLKTMYDNRKFRFTLRGVALSPLSKRPLTCY